MIQTDPIEISKFYTNIHGDISSFQNLDSIFQKLESEQKLEKLGKVLQLIYEDEQIYALQGIIIRTKKIELTQTQYRYTQRIVMQYLNISRKLQNYLQYNIWDKKIVETDIFNKEQQLKQASKTSIDFTKQSYGVIIEEDEKQSPSFSIESLSNFSKGAEAVQSENKNESFTSNSTENYKKSFELFIEKNCKVKISKENIQENKEKQKKQNTNQQLQTLDLFLKKISQEENVVQVQDRTIKKKKNKKKIKNKSRKISQKKLRHVSSTTHIKNYSQQFSKGGQRKIDILKKNSVQQSDKHIKQKLSKNNSQIKQAKNKEKQQFMIESKTQHQKSLQFLKKLMS